MKRRKIVKNGALAGSMLGYALSSASYRVLLDSLKAAKLAIPIPANSGRSRADTFSAFLSATVRIRAMLTAVTADLTATICRREYPSAVSAETNRPVIPQRHEAIIIRRVFMDRKIFI